MHLARCPGRRPAVLAALAATALLVSACAALRPPPGPAEREAPPVPRDVPDARVPEHRRTVTASAYNSVPEQTKAFQPALAAWGDRLAPGMQVIAVSRDLIEAGLTRGTRVWIDGLEGEYVVLDKMASRWRNKIDIYMGEDVDAARRWGVREVRIRWSPPGR